MSVSTYIIATEAMAKERADTLLRHRAAVSDTNHILDYFRLTADHRLLFGGGESYTTATPRHLVAEAVAGQAERFDLLSRIKHRPFPGGALMRMPALMLGMLCYRLRDLL